MWWSVATPAPVRRPSPTSWATHRGPLGAGRPEAVSELIFTSGTEARPKAIMHTEQTTNFSVRVAYDDLGLSEDDVVWMPSPLGHSTGFNYGLRFALYHGLRLVLQDRWDGAAAAALVRDERCSYTLGRRPRFSRTWSEAADQRRRAARSPCGSSGAGGRRCRPHLVDAAGSAASGSSACTGPPRCWWGPGTGRARASSSAATPTGCP